MLDIENSEKDKTMKTNENEAFQRLSKAIQIRTVSFQGTSQTGVKPFLDFHRLLEESYPKIHGLLERKVINNYHCVIDGPAMILSWNQLLYWPILMSFLSVLRKKTIGVMSHSVEKLLMVLFGVGEHLI